MSEGEKKQIEGVCDEITEKNGWTSFAINVGTQYPVRLSTKLPALIEQGRAAGQQRAVWSFKESQGKENPNKPGTYYTNRYLDGVVVGGEIDETLAATPPAPRSAGGGPKTPDERGSIERQTIVKAAISLYPDAVILTDGDFFRLLAKLERFCASGYTGAVLDEEDIPF